MFSFFIQQIVCLFLIITGTDTQLNDQFGFSQDSDNNIVVIGAPEHNNGAVYIFKKNKRTWKQLLKIEEPNTNQFGYDISFKDNVLVVGSNNDTAYIYENFCLTSILTGPTTFGRSVDTDGKQIMIGAPFDSPNGVLSAGSAHVFTKQNCIWILQEQILAPVLVQGQRFGFDIAIDNNFLVVGAPGSLIFLGKVYFYKFNGNWNHLNTENGSDISQDSLFGFSVDIKGDFAIIGGPFLRTKGGGAYLFKFDELLDQFQETQLLRSSLTQPDDTFGYDVKITDNVILVGDPSFREDDYGLVTVFIKQPNHVWIETGNIIGPEINGQFGSKVSLYNNIIVGSENNRVIQTFLNCYD